MRELRNKLGLSQEEFGARCGLDRSCISKIEPEVRYPTLMVLCQIAEGVETSLERAATVDGWEAGVSDVAPR